MTKRERMIATDVALWLRRIKQHESRMVKA